MISFNAPVFGLRAAQTNLDNTAHSVANVNTSGFAPENLHQSEMQPSETAITGAKPDTPDPARDMADLKVSKNAYSANLKMIRVQNNTLGELIDLVG
ncbi:MAG: hypothetical protein ACLFQB_09775 [Chitinispirillaceae bacterium]